MRQTRPALALISRSTDQDVEDYADLLLHLLAFVPDKDAKSPAESLCQEVRRLTRGQVSLLLSGQGAADPQAIPSYDGAIFPVRDGHRIYGSLHVSSHRRQPAQTALPLEMVQVLAKLCGVLLHHFELDALIEGQCRRLSCQVYDPLTKREMELLKLLCRGQTREEISALLQITPESVSTYQKRVCRKLDVHSERDLPLAAYQTGLFSLLE
jgi:DNA-binding CsgD family transcriptional regulator